MPQCFYALGHFLAKECLTKRALTKKRFSKSGFSPAETSASRIQIRAKLSGSLNDLQSQRLLLNLCTHIKELPTSLLVVVVAIRTAYKCKN
jgi:hypothetical protein